MTEPHKTRVNEWPRWPDGRGWAGIGIYLLTLLILIMLWRDRSLRSDEFFQAIAVLVIGTGFVNGVVAWAFSATQGGGELAKRNADVVETMASGAAEKIDQPQEVKVINEPKDPVPTETAEASAPAEKPTEDLPDYAR